MMKYLDECFARGVLRCRKCKLEKPVDEFVKNKREFRGYTTICLPCNRLDDHGYRFKKFQGHGQRNRIFKLKDYNWFIQNKPDTCEICKEVLPLVLDHCHKNNFIRGWLCNPCNKGLGHFRDNVNALKTAVKYLNKKAPA